MVGINPAKVIISNFKRSLGDGEEIIIKAPGGIRQRMFPIRGGNVGSPIDLDWGESGNYGADSEVGIY